MRGFSYFINHFHGFPSSSSSKLLILLSLRFSCLACTFIILLQPFHYVCVCSVWYLVFCFMSLIVVLFRMISCWDHVMVWTFDVGIVLTFVCMHTKVVCALFLFFFFFFFPNFSNYKKSFLWCYINWIMILCNLQWDPLRIFNFCFFTE